MPRTKAGTVPSLQHHRATGHACVIIASRGHYYGRWGSAEPTAECHGLPYESGFAGMEATLGQRNLKANVTTLSGDIGARRDAADNSHHVVTASGLTAPTTLDGFTVRAGHADPRDAEQQRGGGLWVVDSANWLPLARVGIIFAGVP